MVKQVKEQDKNNGDELGLVRTNWAVFKEEIMMTFEITDKRLEQKKDLYSAIIGVLGAVRNMEGARKRLNHSLIRKAARHGYDLAEAGFGFHKGKDTDVADEVDRVINRS